MNRFCLVSASALLALLTVPALADIPPPKPKPEPKPEEKTAEVELPWTVDQIREAWGTGRSFLYDVEVEDNGKGWARFETEDVSEKGFKRSSVMCEKGKAEKRQSPGEITWERHLGELKTMLKTAEKAEVEITVPYMTLTCVQYTMKREGGWQKLWLHSGVPGLFVQMEREFKRGEKVDYEKLSLRAMEEPSMLAPWTADKLAEHFKDGATMKFTSKSDDGQGRFEVAISAADIDGLTYTTLEAHEGQEPKTGEARTETWDAFFRHMSTPRHDTRTGEETLKTVLGETACILFHHESAKDDVKVSQKVWLAKDKPGVLVRMEQSVTVGDKVQSFVLELAEFKKGK